MNPSKYFQDIKIMLMSWCNEKQCDVLDEKILILMLSLRKLNSWCCNRSEITNDVGVTGEEQNGKKRRKVKLHETMNSWWRRIEYVCSYRWRNGVTKESTRFFLGKVELFCFLTSLSRRSDSFSSLRGGSERAKNTHQTKAHGSWCSFLTTLVQLQWFCHTESEGDRKLAPI